ncbi:MAG: histidine phosphatase family protein, partial [Alphaproteobacteria bacterium]
MAFAMVTLSLLRHAKSAWDTPIRSDFERPLARRGIKAARRIGVHVEREGLVPELVLCSSALRARETIELAAEAWEKQPEIRYLDRLYHAAPGVMLDALCAV